MYCTDVTYMNQNMKMARATPTVASAMMTKITLPAIAPESGPPILLPGCIQWITRS